MARRQLSNGRDVPREVRHQPVRTVWLMGLLAQAMTGSHCGWWDADGQPVLPSWVGSCESPLSEAERRQDFDNWLSDLEQGIES